MILRLTMLIEVLLFWFCFQFESSRILPGWSLCLSRDENGWQFASPLQPDPEFQPPLKLFCFSETEPGAKFSRWPETRKRRWPPWLDGDRFVMSIFWKQFFFSLKRSNRENQCWAIGIINIINLMCRN